MAFLRWLESTGFSAWILGSPSILAYPTVLAFHTFSMAAVAGVSTAIALRTLGVASDLPLAGLDRYLPIVWVGFWVSFVSGVMLFVGDATVFATSPGFIIKLLAIAVALVSLRRLRGLLFGRGGSGNTPSAQAKSTARLMLACWLVAVTAGRLTAYDAFIGRQTAVGVLIMALVLGAGYFAMNRVTSTR